MSDRVDHRPGADACYKCASCDSACPVAAVDETFPGPKFQGPEQWRLTRREDDGIDPSIEGCSNCMRCAGACPTGVPLLEMHTAARARYVAEDVPRWSRSYLRAKLLGNYGRLGGLASRTPRLANALASFGPARWVAERLLGITAEREFPPFATETFREWWERRGGPQVEDTERRVAYFHGDYANYNTPEVGRALVRVFEHFGYEVAVPVQRCSGTPMFANGLLDDAEAAARVNVESLGALVEEGYDVVCSCTSCSMALRREYPAVFNSLENVDRLAAHTWDALEYLRVHEDLESALAAAGGSSEAVTYHAPCHARVQGLGHQTVDLLSDAPVAVDDAGDSCSGISGTYGWKAERYGTSMAIGEELFEHMAASDADTGLTECPTCAMQMEHGSGTEVRHTLELVEDLLMDEGVG